MQSGVAPTNPEAIPSAVAAAWAPQGLHRSVTASAAALLSFFWARNPVFCQVPVSLPENFSLKMHILAVGHQGGAQTST